MPSSCFCVSFLRSSPSSSSSSLACDSADAERAEVSSSQTRVDCATGTEAYPAPVHLRHMLAGDRLVDVLPLCTARNRCGLRGRGMPQSHLNNLVEVAHRVRVRRDRCLDHATLASERVRLLQLEALISRSFGRWVCAANCSLAVRGQRKQLGRWCNPSIGKLCAQASVLPPHVLQLRIHGVQRSVVSVRQAELHLLQHILELTNMQRCHGTGRS
mmetsp:Transcript_63984/g.208054  ORF Transcript_63984/g.208054 Transcript_63984/m.208054 type:complete len:215 (-) Transcript_63984:72-716(-)